MSDHDEESLCREAGGVTGEAPCLSADDDRTSRGAASCDSLRAGPAAWAGSPERSPGPVTTHRTRRSPHSLEAPGEDHRRPRRLRCPPGVPITYALREGDTPPEMGHLVNTGLQHDAETTRAVRGDRRPGPSRDQGRFSQPVLCSLLNMRSHVKSLDRNLAVFPPIPRSAGLRPPCPCGRRSRSRRQSLSHGPAGRGAG